MADPMVCAFAECYTEAELAELLKGALADLAAGVKVTSLQLEGGGGTGRAIEGDPERMVWILRQAKRKRAADDADPGSGDKHAAPEPIGAGRSGSG